MIKSPDRRLDIFNMIAPPRLAIPPLQCALIKPSLTAFEEHCNPKKGTKVPDWPCFLDGARRIIIKCSGTEAAL
jgi:hypothetical protein